MRLLLNVGVNPNPVRAFQYAIENDRYEIVEYLKGRGLDDKIVERNKKYLKYNSLIERVKIRAQRKLYYWWIQICYDPMREVGKRMMKRSWERFLILNR